MSAYRSLSIQAIMPLCITMRSQLYVSNTGSWDACLGIYRRECGLHAFQVFLCRAALTFCARLCWQWLRLWMEDGKQTIIHFVCWNSQRHQHKCVQNNVCQSRWCIRSIFIHSVWHGMCWPWHPHHALSKRRTDFGVSYSVCAQKICKIAVYTSSSESQQSDEAASVKAQDLHCRNHFWTTQQTYRWVLLYPSVNNLVSQTIQSTWYYFFRIKQQVLAHWIQPRVRDLIEHG